MPIEGNRRPFKSKRIDIAPDVPGVYALFRDKDLVYVGMSEQSIRARLQSHKRGDEKPGTKTVTHFKVEPASSPKRREDQLLREYQRGHDGQLPRHNVQGPPPGKNPK